MTERIIVIGAGIGGLTTAAELARAGCEVTVLERAPAPGGKLREILIDGQGIDSGPTVMTMRWVFDEFFAALGSSTEERINLHFADRLARHWWGPDSVLDLYADPQKSAAAIEKFAGPAEARGYLRFSAEARRIYRSLDKTFMQAGKTGVAGLCLRFGWSGLPDLFRLRPYTSLWAALGQYFRDPRLQQLFGRYAGYCGSSPFLAPATLMLVAHAEREGVWLVEGGMYRIVEALTGLLEQNGGHLRTNCHVQQIMQQGDRVTGVELADGERLAADAVVCNADVAALAAGLLGAGVSATAQPVTAENRSMSALTWSLLADVSGQPLIRHNVFFSADYRREFADIFAVRRAPDAPTVYVCAQDRDDSGQGGPGEKEKLLIIVNAPADGDVRELTRAEIEQCATKMLDHLATCGLKISFRARDVQVTTPTEFNRMFPGTGGALYGRASHGWMSSFRRAGSRTRLSNLYLAGGSTHPGPGVPMAMLSGRLAAGNVLADLASPRR